MISGFTIVRNATILDYPFRESVRSLLKFCDEVIINCGDSDDDTLPICAELERESLGKIKVLKTHWERKNQIGGFQLKHQTDVAMAECRGEWCFYLQADEVLHEADIPAIHLAMKRADSLPDIDGILFDYLHFYANYDHVIQGRNWYRREVRAFKNKRDIQAFRDAQGFRREGDRLRVIPSGARVFHYGHVRSIPSLKNKAEQMAQWWGEKARTDLDALMPRRHVGLTKFQDSHPQVMQGRLDKASEYFDPMKCPRKWDRDELKNAITFAWESLVPYRIGEFRNYELVRP